MPLSTRAGSRGIRAVVPSLAAVSRVLILGAALWLGGADSVALAQDCAALVPIMPGTGWKQGEVFYHFQETGPSKFPTGARDGMNKAFKEFTDKLGKGVTFKLAKTFTEVNLALSNGIVMQKGSLDGNRSAVTSTTRVVRENGPAETVRAQMVFDLDDRDYYDPFDIRTYQVFILKVGLHEISHTFNTDDHKNADGTPVNACTQETPRATVVNNSCGKNDSQNNMPTALTPCDKLRIVSTPPPSPGGGGTGGTGGDSCSAFLPDIYGCLSVCTGELSYYHGDGCGTAWGDWCGQLFPGAFPNGDVSGCGPDSQVQMLDSSDVIIRSGGCTFNASPAAVEYGPGGGVGSTTLTAGAADCAWAASSSANWITLTGDLSGSGNGVVNFNVDDNTTSAPRTGTLSVGGVSVAINQAGVGCSTTLAPSSASMGRGSASGSVTVSTAPEDCSWVAVSSVPWMTVGSGQSGSGSGTVGYTIAANESGAVRTGTLGIGGRTFAVTQESNFGPIVTVTSPGSLASFARGANIDLTATATDADGVIRVEFYIDNTLVASDTVPPFAGTWANASSGWHTLTAKAFDTHEMSRTSAPISFGVNSLDTLTFVPVTPRAGETVTITVTGANPCGAVDLNYGDGTHVTYAISGLPMTRTHIWETAGNVSLVATGHGNCFGLLTTTVPIATNAGPSVAITAPSAGSRIVHPSPVVVSATASDSEGVSRVEFYANNVLLGAASAAPFSVTWQPFAGTYTLLAKAYDGLNVANTSAAVSITVTDVGGLSFSPAAPVQGQVTNVTVSGSPGCGAVTIDYGDGTAITYAINGLPTTQSHSWASAGAKTITATGQSGNCVGSTTTSVAVSTNPAPSITISAPASGSVYTSGTALTISATASDTHGIARVEFYAGASLLGTDTNAPYTQAWSVPSGTVSLVARAYDGYGAVADSAPVSVTGRDVVSVSVSPTSLTAGSTANVTVTGSGGCGAVTINYGDGTAITYAINGLPTTQAHIYSTGGSKGIIATGQSGNCVGQASTSVYVNYAPEVTLTAPANGNTYVGPATVHLSANASDADGSISQVYFYRNGTLLASDSTAPYAYDWTNVAVGSYSFYAVAVDNTGASRTSATAAVSITNPGPAQVTSIVAPASVTVGQTATVTVYGTNPCGLVWIAWGDGVGWHHAISQLPYSYGYAWSSPGTYTITAIGGGNCTGQATTTITVTGLEAKARPTLPAKGLGQRTDPVVQAGGQFEPFASVMLEALAPAATKPKEDLASIGHNR